MKNLMTGCLIAKKIVKLFNNKRIEVSFSLEKGTSLALLGASGAGKTTILKMISGLVNIDEGKLELDGVDITGVPAGKRRIGMVFQDYALFPHLNVGNNIAYGLKCRGIGKREIEADVNRLLKLFQIEHIASALPGSISGGEKQRVALARTIAVGDEVILFDEPLSALDTPLRKKLQDELRMRQREMGYTAVYVTHDELEAEIMADKIIMIE